jgi:hypothetical protein
MKLGTALEETANALTSSDFDKFRQHLDPAWIQRALAATGKASLRNRSLPAQQVVWLVLGMALYRNRPITEIVDALDLALPGPRPTSGGIAKARGRLGSKPLELLFQMTSQAWAYASADAHRWHGLAVFGVDGSTATVADSTENRDEFGGHTTRRGQSGYPLLRMVALMAVRSHLLADVVFGPYCTDERVYAKELWESVPANSVCLMDRNFLAGNILVPLVHDRPNRHWVTRAKSSTTWQVRGKLGRQDQLVELNISAPARKDDPTLPKTYTARAIGYQRKGFTPQWILTSLLDPEKYPAAEIVELYHERWELELGFDEIKTEMLDRRETLRSQNPEKVRQEMWGVLLAYNLVRLEMERIADEAGVPPVRISFVAALRAIRDEWMWSEWTKPGAIPRRLKQMRLEIGRCLLPPRRTERSYPRAVKIKMSSYKRKLPRDRPVTSPVKTTG